MSPTSSAESLIQNVCQMVEELQAALPEGMTEVAVPATSLFAMREMLQTALHRLPVTPPEAGAPARGILFGILLALFFWVGAVAVWVAYHC
jgi:hypothetical protein